MCIWPDEVEIDARLPVTLDRLQLAALRPYFPSAAYHSF